MHRNGTSKAGGSKAGGAPSSGDASTSQKRRAEGASRKPRKGLDADAVLLALGRRLGKLRDALLPALVDPSMRAGAASARLVRSQVSRLRRYKLGRRAVDTCALFVLLLGLAVLLAVGPLLGQMLALPLQTFWNRVCTDVRTAFFAAAFTSVAMLASFQQAGWLE